MGCSGVLCSGLMVLYGLRPLRFCFVFFRSVCDLDGSLFVILKRKKMLKADSTWSEVRVTKATGQAPRASTDSASGLKCAVRALDQKQITRSTYQFGNHSRVLRNTPVNKNQRRVRHTHSLT